jgi:hypothetical protein
MSSTAYCTQHAGDHSPAAAIKYLRRAAFLFVVGTSCAVPISAAAQESPAGSLSPLDLFIKSYIDEWGAPPKSDPNAPPTRWPSTLLPPQPQTIPPYPFTEWPFGGASAIGATVPNSQGGALMKALAPTDFGKWLKSNNVEIYGWVNGGGNLSNAAGPNFKNANFPAAYMYSANQFTFDQAVVYVERLAWPERPRAHWCEDYR